jgi:hypothetical protein
LNRQDARDAKKIAAGQEEVRSASEAVSGPAGSALLTLFLVFLGVLGDLAVQSFCPFVIL